MVRENGRQQWGKFIVSGEQLFYIMYRIPLLPTDERDLNRFAATAIDTSSAFAILW
jgi:hypothetical protein